MARNAKKADSPARAEGARGKSMRLSEEQHARLLEISERSGVAISQLETWAIRMLEGSERIRALIRAREAINQELGGEAALMQVAHARGPVPAV